MSEITFDVSGLEDSSDNRCKAFEVRFTIPVNAEWLRHVIQEELTKSVCRKCKEKFVASPPDFGNGLCKDCASQMAAEDG